MWLTKSMSGAPMIAFELGIVLSPAQEELLHADHVCRGAGTKDDNVFEIGGDAVDACDGFINFFNK